MTDVRHTHSFIHVFEISRCFHVGLQVEPEDVAVRELWSVVPRGLHTVSNQAITVWRQVRYWALPQKALCVQNYRFVITIKGFIWLQRRVCSNAHNLVYRGVLRQRLVELNCF